MDAKDKTLLTELKVILIGKSGTSEEGISGAINKIEKHLERINGTNAEQEIKIARNRDRISTQWKIGGSLLALIGTGLLGMFFHMLGAF